MRTRVFLRFISLAVLAITFCIPMNARSFILLEPAAIEWNKAYGGPNFDNASCVVQTRDNGYAFVGSTWLNDTFEFWLVKTDYQGNVEWNKTYELGQWDIAQSLIQTGDEGFLFTGLTSGSGYMGVGLIKTDNLGNVQWYETFESGGYYEPRFFVVQTEDDGYALGGSRVDAEYSESFWLIKLASDGNPQWNQTYWHDPSGIGCLSDLIRTKDGGFLMCNEDSAIGANQIWGNVDQNRTRYYDEQAECLEIFSFLGDLGVVGAKGYALQLWNHLNNDGWFDEQGWYWYRPAWKAWECEMGGFAMIISRYLGHVSPQVLSDVDWKLLRNGWDSGCWADNVIVHAYDPIYGHFDNSQKRPLETNTVWHALHSLYSEMTPDMKGNMTSMPMGNSSVSPAWMLSMNSGWFGDGDVRKLNGAMVMFLTGIVPVTGSLDLGLIEEDGSENIASYGSANLQFDYANHRIRIPVKNGELKFLFGTEPATWNFSEDGTYDISFADDWNLITGAKLVSSSSEVYDIADLNRDGIVDMYDAIALSISFDSRVGDTNWNPRADLNFDQQIDLYDALILAGHFGEHHL